MKPIKKILLTLLIIVSFLFSCKSNSKKLTLSEGFAAFIVKDIDTSINWYTSKLGFNIISKTNLEERGIKQANLKLGNTSIELIEGNSSIDPTESGTKKGLVQGIFKIGFAVPHFNKWKNHLIKQQLITEKDVVINPMDSKKMLIIKDPDGNRIQLFEN